MNEPVLRRLNILAENIASTIPAPEDIPTLSPASAIKQWMGDDKTPYFKCQGINYPITANGINYKESFFQEFVNKLSDRPHPGSKTGHEMMWGVRPNTDLLLVGGKLQKNGDGTGVVLLKNYIPPKADSDNENFIKECKADMVHFSLVAYTKDEIIQDDKGITINVIGSIRGERNDAVEYGMGAMEQKTNEHKSDIELIPETPAVGGKFNIFGEVTMDPEKKKELMKTLVGLKTNGEITLPEIAEGMGLKQQIVTDEHLEAVKVVNSLKELGLKDPVADTKALQKTIADGIVAVRNAMITKEFGPEKFANGKENDLRTFVCSQIKDETGDALTTRMNEIKSNSIAKKLAAEQADYRSEINIASVEHTATGTQPTEGGIRVDKM
jgi:hypothetical protein